MKAPLKPKVKGPSKRSQQSHSLKTHSKKQSKDAWARWIAALEAEGKDVAAVLAEETALEGHLPEESLASDSFLDTELRGETDETFVKVVLAEQEIADQESTERENAEVLEQSNLEQSQPELSQVEQADIDQAQLDESEPAQSEGNRTFDWVEPVSLRTGHEPIAPITEPTQPVSELPGTDTVEESQEDYVEPELTDSPSWYHSKVQTAAMPEPPPEQGTSNIDQTLLTTQPNPLPFKPFLESRLGESLDNIDAYIGTPEARSVLKALNADAAHYNQKILIADRNPDISTVAHEVIHALQLTPQINSSADSGIAEASPNLLPATAPAEQEADQLTEAIAHAFQSTPEAIPAKPLTIKESVQSTDIACLRNAPATKSPTTPAPNSIAIDPAVTPETTKDLEQPKAVKTANLGPAAKSENRTSPAGKLPSTPESSTEPQPNAEPAATLEESGEIQLTPPPEPGITEEEVEAQKEKIVIAQAAIKAAQTPEQLAAALATAPPTVKANHYNQLGNTLSDVAAKEKQTFSEAIPTYEAKLSAKTPPAPTLKSLDKTQIDKAPPTATPAPTPELTAQPQQAEPFTSDPAVLTTVNKLPEQPSPQRAEALEKTLESVQTTDPEALAKFSDRPTVPQQGDSDPQLVQKQSEAQTQNAQAAKADAAKEVLNGPGPEKVKPRTVNQKAEIGELKQLEVQQPEPVAGIDDFQQMQLPVEVQTAFDQKHQETMQSSLESSKQKLAETTQKRDADRQEKVVATKESVKAENAKAHKEQQDLVKTSQRNIQQQRLDTMTHQKSELKRVSADIKERKESENKAIGDRIQTDEGKVKTHYGQEEAKAKKQVEKGEQAAEEKKKKAKEKAKNEGWFSQAVNFLKERFNDLTKAIKGVFDIVRKAVNKILDAAQKFAIGLINKAAKWVKAQIKKFASFAKGLVDGLLKKHFPKLTKVLNKKIDELANKANKLVDQTALKLKKGVKNAVKGLRKGINAVLDTFEKGLNAAIAFMQAAFAGDWKAVLKMALEAVLAVIGIKPEEFYKFAGRAENTFKAIINNPLGFAKNLVNAFLLGMKNFSGKFLKYLKAGIIGWLTGALGSAGIEIPKKFDLLGVLDLVRQVAGITFELLKKKATKLIGAKNVERVEFVVGQIKSLVEKGWDGFLKEIKESFTGLKEQVMNGIRDFLVTKIVISAVTKLASLFNPAGAIVQLVLTMWNLYTFVRDQLGRMVEMVKAVVGGVEKIAKKEYKPAAEKVEEVLANFLPLAIDLLAKVLGLGGISKKVRDILKKVQKKISNAVDKLIFKFFKRSKGKEKKYRREDHPRLARKAILELKAKVPQNTAYMSLRKVKEKEARIIEKKYKGLLAKGIGLYIVFEKLPDKNESQLNFTVEIKPNNHKAGDGIQVQDSNSQALKASSLTVLVRRNKSKETLRIFVQSMYRHHEKRRKRRKNLILEQSLKRHFYWSDRFKEADAKEKNSVAHHSLTEAVAREDAKELGKSFQIRMEKAIEQAESRKSPSNKFHTSPPNYSSLPTDYRINGRLYKLDNDAKQLPNKPNHFFPVSGKQIEALSKEIFKLLKQFKQEKGQSEDLSADITNEENLKKTGKLEYKFFEMLKNQQRGLEIFVGVTGNDSNNFRNAVQFILSNSLEEREKKRFDKAAQLMFSLSEADVMESEFGWTRKKAQKIIKAIRHLREQFNEYEEKNEGRLITLAEAKNLDTIKPKYANTLSLYRENYIVVLHRAYITGRLKSE
ncbi:MAG: hypothetical protein AAFN40_14600 [Cyanobacteria bacterium J06560_6]